ncbi:MAG: hypothetical protein O7G88_04115 [bacterium]|nr:hypothetical protein [bacterium]
MKLSRAYTICWLGCILLLLGLAGCEPLYQSYQFTEALQTELPITVVNDEVWVTSIPAGADVYVQPFDPERVPSHAIAPEMWRGKTPLRFTLSPGTYWIELALDAEVFENYFSPPYDDAQFEQDGAVSEALLFQPFAPGEKRRVLRYYRLEKQQQGHTLIALFHPRGEPLERVAALYPQQEQYQVASEQLRNLLERAQVPPDVQDQFVTLLKRGGKAVWRVRDTYKVSLELQSQAVSGHVIMLYSRAPMPDPLIPDGGGF